MSDKALHIQVAEALGWTHIGLPSPEATAYESGLHIGDPPWPGDAAETIPRYDADWSVTGPLIEEYQLAIGPQRVLKDGKRSWQALAWGVKHGASMSGPTPLVAVCRLILALKKAGKLIP